MNRITRTLLMLPLSFAPVLCWAAEPKADKAKAIAEHGDDADSFAKSLIEENMDMRVKLDKAQLLNRHYCQVITILKNMPVASELLSLDEIGFDDEGRINLRPVAQADLKAGRINFLLSGGLSHPANGAFHKRMHEKYGINYIDFGLGCTTEPFIRKSVEEHNAVVTEFLHKKYPKYDVETEKEWEASVSEQEKNSTAPTRHTR